MSKVVIYHASIQPMIVYPQPWILLPAQPDDDISYSAAGCSGTCSMHPGAILNASQYQERR